MNSRPARHALWFAVAAALVGGASLARAEEAPTKILFIGNSFTHGNFQPTLRYNAANVHDLNNSGYGGVPGIFQTLTVEAGLSFDVSIEAVSGQSLQYHYNNKKTQIGSSTWDYVVMHDYSTLSSSSPGNPNSLYTYSKLLEQYIHGTGSVANANGSAATQVFLMETWARADQVYNTPNGYWNGTSIEKMQGDLHTAYYTAAAQDTQLKGVIPVGDAWLLAVHSGVADRNPYDGLDSGKINLWNVDSYHASAWGSYLEAMTIFGQITGLDPRSFGGSETVATAFGIAPATAVALQGLAWQQLQISAVPEPESWAMLLAGLGVVGRLATRRRQQKDAVEA